MTVYSIKMNGCKAIFKDSKKVGFNYIGDFRTNRVIFQEIHKRLGIKLY